MRESRGRSQRTLRFVYRIPLVLAAISLFGLVAALIVDGPIDLLWTSAVAVPLIAIGWAAIGSK